MEHLRSTFRTLIEHDQALKATHQDLIDALEALTPEAELMGRGDVHKLEIELYREIVEELEQRIEAHAAMLAMLDDERCPFCGEELGPVGTPLVA
jgi:DNA repair exonuclease SbcCD ATPase subunit